MSESIKATRTIVRIGSLEVEGFMLPDGSYRMSQTQASECIGDDPVYARNFLTSKALKALRGEGYTPETFEVSSEDQARGQTRIRGWTLDIVWGYWNYRCFKGNEQAYKLVSALGVEGLERRFDRAFGISRSEDEWDRRIAEAMLRQYEVQFKEALDDKADADYQIQFLLQRLKQEGVDDPYATNNDKDE